MLFINVKKCWRLNSIFKIGEFLHVNKKTFTFKEQAVEHKMSRPGFSEFQRSMCKFVPNFIRRYIIVVAKYKCRKILHQSMATSI